MTTAHLSRIVLGLGTYFFPVNALSKQKRAMRRGIRKSRELKVRLYAGHLIDLNDYLDAFPVAKASDKIGEMELNKIILNSMPNGWIKQAYVKGFYFEAINF